MKLSKTSNIVVVVIVVKRRGRPENESRLESLYHTIHILYRDPEPFTMFMTPMLQVEVRCIFFHPFFEVESDIVQDMDAVIDVGVAILTDYNVT